MFHVGSVSIESIEKKSTGRIASHVTLFFSQTAHGEVISRRQSVERMTELQQSKYQDLQAGLPSELSMQLAEVALALGSAEDQVTNCFHWEKKVL